MQRVNEFNFFELGMKIHPLTDLPEDDGSVKFSLFWYRWWEARTALDTICESRPFSVTLSAARKLRQTITEVVPESIKEVGAKFPSDLAQEESIHVWNVHQIRDAAREFETILAAECQVLDTYLVSKKGAYSTADLITHAHQHIPESAHNRVSAQTKADFDEAGKAIAFDLPTAAAFHLLRGTEGVLREYYDLGVPGPKKAPPKMRSWGVYIRLLSEYNADSKVMSLLTHLKDAYRNPVLHPEENYTDDRVQVLFGVCVSAIVMMVEELDKLAAAPALLGFPSSGITVAAAKTGRP